MEPELKFASLEKIVGSMAASYLKLEFKPSEPLEWSWFNKFMAVSLNADLLLEFDSLKSTSSTVSL